MNSREEPVQVNSTVNDMFKAAKKVLANVDFLCYFGSSNQNIKKPVEEKFFQLLYTIDKLVQYASNKSQPNVSTLYPAQTRFALSLEEKALLGTDFSRVGILSADDLEYLASMKPKASSMVFNKSVILYDPQKIFSAKMSLILRKIGFKSLFDLSPNEKLHVESQIASYISELTDPEFQKDYIALIKTLDYSCDFTCTVFTNAIKCLAYGSGNCELQTYLAFVEFIRITGSQFDTLPLSCIKFTPRTSSGDALEELNFMVVGNWPSERCLIISPWSTLEKNRISYWEGSLAKTEILTNLYPSIDISESKDGFRVSYRRETKPEVVAKTHQIINDNYTNLLQLREPTLRTIRSHYCDYLTHFSIDNPVDEFLIESLRRMQPGPYAHRFEADVCAFKSLHNPSL